MMTKLRLVLVVFVIACFFHGAQCQARHVVYLGAFENADFKGINDAHGRLYQTVVKRVRTGDVAAKAYFDEIDSTAEGKDLKKNFAIDFGSTAAASITRLKSESGVSGRIAPEALDFSFFMIDDAVLMSSRTSADLNKVSIYIFVSFYIYDFQARQIIHTAEYIIPIEGATMEADVWAYGESLLGGEKLVSAFSGLLTQLSKTNLAGAGIRRALAGVAKGNTAQVKGGYAAIEIAKGLPIVASVPQSTAVQLSGAPDHVSFRRLAAYLLTGAMAKEFPLVPSFVVDDSLGIKPESVSSIILQFSAVLSQLTDYTLAKATEGKDGCSSADRICHIKDNPFPTIDYRIVVSLKMGQRAKTDGDIRRDTFTVDGVGKVLMAGDGTPICPRSKGKYPSIHYDLNNEYHAKGAVYLGDVNYFNALFLAATKGNSGFVFTGPTGAYGDSNNFTFGNCG